MAGAPAIVVGNAIGSDIANVLLIIGTAAVAGTTIRIDREPRRVDLPLPIASAGFLLVAVWTGPFAWYEGDLALLGLGVYARFTFSEEDRLDEVVEEAATETEIGPSTYETIAVGLARVFLANLFATR